MPRPDCRRAFIKNYLGQLAGIIQGVELCDETAVRMARKMDLRDVQVPDQPIEGAGVLFARVSVRMRRQMTRLAPCRSVPRAQWSGVPQPRASSRDPGRVP
jgi:hypothetical protein